MEKRKYKTAASICQSIEDRLAVEKLDLLSHREEIVRLEGRIEMLSELLDDPKALDDDGKDGGGNA